MMDTSLLYRFFAGSASYEEEEAVCNWVEADPENMETFKKERRLYDAVLLSSSGSAASGSEAGTTVKMRERRRFLFPAVSIAAALMIFFLGGLCLHSIFSSKDATACVVKVPPTERANVVLPDGTSVWLNSGSDISYPSAFSRKDRKVTLQGEAQFDVVKDAAHPFIVHTSSCDLVVHGTRFNVRTANEGAPFEVALFEGALELTDDVNDTTIAILSPMQKATIDNGSCRLSAVTDMNVYRWKDGLICFENESFPDLMARFSKIFGVNIVVRDKKLANFSSSGKFRTADGLDFILQVLQRSVDFRFSHSPDGGTIYIDPPLH